LVQLKIKCSGVIFLGKDDSDTYALVSGNRDGCELYSNQEHFFGFMALKAESEGMYARSYSGRFFKGEKFGLDRLETALVLPVQFHGKTEGCLILLNKQDQKNFSLADSKLLEVLLRTIQPVLFREKEKSSIVKRFKQFVSDQVVYKLLNDESKESSKESRKEITVLFVDLNGFTVLSETVEPSILIQQVNDFLSAMTQVVFDCGGVLDKYIGDEVMALFGAMDEDYDHAIRAVECGILMQSAMERLQEKWNKNDLQSLSASIGVFTGPALVGTIGCDKYMDFTAIGDTVNTASRLTKAADDGQMLIGQETFEKAGAVLHTEPVRGLSLKGVRAHNQFYKVIQRWPESELKTQIEYLGVAERVNLISCLSQYQCYQDCNLPIECLRDSNDSVRLEAVKTLLKLNREKDVQVLLGHLIKEHNEEIRALLLENLGRISGRVVSVLLEDYFSGFDRDTRMKLVELVCGSTYFDEKKLLLPLINDADHQVRAHVAHALYRYGDHQVLDVLNQMLRSGIQEVQQAAISVFGKIGTVQVVQPLMDLLETSPGFELRVSIGKAISRLKPGVGLEYLKYIVMESPELHVWQYFIKLIESQSDNDSLLKQAFENQNIEVLVACLEYLAKERVQLQDELILWMFKNAPYEQLKISCLRLLNPLNNDSFGELFEQQFQTESDEIRAAFLSEAGFRRLHSARDTIRELLRTGTQDEKSLAAISLSMLGEKGDLGALVQAFYDADNANVKATIIKALGGFYVEESISLLKECLHSPIARIRANAIESMDDAVLLDCKDDLIGMLDDDNNRVRANVIVALWKTGVMKLEQQLVSMLNSEDKWMRLSAIWAVGEIGELEGTALMEKRITDPDYDVRLKAIMTLGKIDKKFLHGLEELMETAD
jgi:class 3 adenylate cyclase/HEAT repeat protein